MGDSSVAVGGTGVAVGGTGVAVGGSGVSVGGTRVAVGGSCVAVGGGDVGASVGGTGVALAASTTTSWGGAGAAVLSHAPSKAVTNNANMTHAIVNPRGFIWFPPLVPNGDWPRRGAEHHGVVSARRADEQSNERQPSTQHISFPPDNHRPSHRSYISRIAFACIVYHDCEFSINPTSKNRDKVVILTGVCSKPRETKSTGSTRLQDSELPRGDCFNPVNPVSNLGAKS